MYKKQRLQIIYCLMKNLLMSNDDFSLFAESIFTIVVGDFECQHTRKKRESFCLAQKNKSD